MLYITFTSWEGDKYFYVHGLCKTPSTPCSTSAKVPALAESDPWFTFILLVGKHRCARIGYNSFQQLVFPFLHPFPLQHISK